MYDVGGPLLSDLQYFLFSSLASSNSWDDDNGPKWVFGGIIAPAATVVLAPTDDPWPMIIGNSTRCFFSNVTARIRHSSSTSNNSNS